MECCRMSDLQKYLCRFDEILNQMENKMLCRSNVSDITLDFCECMIPHHQAAIYMCENLLKYTECEPLKKIACDIIETQTQGIKEMQEIAKTTCGFVNSQRDVNCYVSQYLSITRNMICRMRNSPQCQNINLSFIGEMIPHHEGAICMCQNLLQYCIDPRLEKIAKSIIKEQSEGVQHLKQVRCMICNG